MQEAGLSSKAGFRMVKWLLFLGLGSGSFRLEQGSGGFLHFRHGTLFFPGCAVFAGLTGLFLAFIGSADQQIAAKGEKRPGRSSTAFLPATPPFSVSHTRPA